MSVPLSSMGPSLDRDAGRASGRGSSPPGAVSQWRTGGPSLSLTGLSLGLGNRQRSWSVLFDMCALHQAREGVGLNGPAKWTEHLLSAGVPGVAEAWSLPLAA